MAIREEDKWYGLTGAMVVSAKDSKDLDEIKKALLRVERLFETDIEYKTTELGDDQLKVEWRPIKKAADSSNACHEKNSGQQLMVSQITRLVVTGESEVSDTMPT